MRRTRYRSAWLVILCVLVLALSVPEGTGASATVDGDPLVSFAAYNTQCITATETDQQLGWRSLLDDTMANHNCASSPATVLIARDRIAPAAAGAPGVHADRRAQSIILR